MLAEIFVLRIEFLARLTAEPPESRLPVPPAQALRLVESVARTGDHHSNQGHSWPMPKAISPTGRFASSNLVGTAK